MMMSQTIFEIWRTNHTVIKRH